MYLHERQAEGYEPPLPSTLDIIKQREWFRDKAYLDSAWIPTIGYGFTSINGRPVKMGDTITQAQADEYLPQKVAQYQNFKKFIAVPLTPAQESALTSFEYNLWPNIWKKDAMPIIEAINKWDIQSAGNYMKQYVNSGWQYVQWLANRRAYEAQLLNA